MKNGSTHKKKRYILDPKEWDFRFIDLNHLHIIGIYEYARSCPWVAPLWENWLKEAFTPISWEKRQQAVKNWTVRDAIRTEFDSDRPVWELGTDEARALMFRMPAILTQAWLSELVFCTPSFPACWSDLPVEEKRAALSLDLGSGSSIREVLYPFWSSESRLTVDIDFDRDYEVLRRDVEKWLCRKKGAFDRRRAAFGLTPLIKKNRGRAHAPRKEALAFLGAFRFDRAGLKFSDAEQTINDWLEEEPSTKKTGYPRPWTKGMRLGLWKKWIKNAESIMVSMFRLRTEQFSPPGILLPSLRNRVI